MKGSTELAESSATAAASTGRFKNRIIELRYMRAGDIRRNPKNWRIHDDRQRAAVESIMSEVGIAGALAAYLDPETGEPILFDGHLRADLDDNEVMPVLITDLTPEEADKILASFDVLGSMANTDVAKLLGLAQTVEFDSHDLTAAISGLLRQDPAVFGTVAPGVTEKPIVPEMELLPQEHYDYVLVLARTRADWHRLLGILRLERTRQPHTRKVGLGRLIEASRLIWLLEGRIPEAPKQEG